MQQCYKARLRLGVIPSHHAPSRLSGFCSVPVELKLNCTVDELSLYVAGFFVFSPVIYYFKKIQDPIPGGRGYYNYRQG
jgi:hypothetical protein